MTPFYPSFEFFTLNKKKKRRKCSSQPLLFWRLLPLFQPSTPPRYVNLLSMNKKGRRRKSTFSDKTFFLFSRLHHRTLATARVTTRQRVESNQPQSNAAQMQSLAEVLRRRESSPAIYATIPEWPLLRISMYVACSTEEEGTPSYRAGWTKFCAQPQAKKKKKKKKKNQANF